MGKLSGKFFSCFAVCFMASFIFILQAVAGTVDQVPLNQYGIRSTNPYVVDRFTSGGKTIDMVIVPGPPRPPAGTYRAEVAKAPVVHVAGVTNSLTSVPALSWSFGCSATSAAMMFGYYDNRGYDNMYAGPTNGGVFPMTNASWGSVVINGESRDQCPLSATRNGLDGRTSRGHVDDYWIQYGSTATDPFITNSWIEHTKGESTGDYMGTNQSSLSNSDGSTTFFYYPDGSPLYDFTGQEPTRRDGCHGMKLFAESRGYTVTTNFNQYIYGYNGNTQGFTFADFKTEIDAGRPVLIQVTGHTMLGYGYDDATKTIDIHDTWDYNNYSMTWGGKYAGMQHYAVTVLRLAAAPIYQLGVTIAGTGGGNVTSSPAGISCNSGSCSADFNSGTEVTLTATPNANSTFFGWSGDCSGNGSCIVNMGAARNTTATFSLIPKARIGSTPYGTLTSAYAAVGSGATIEARNQEFIENLLLNRGVAFILKGGYADDYASRPGYTTLDGILTIGSGRLTVDKLAIK